MITHLGFSKYRARLGEGGEGEENEQALALVTVMDNGSISWSVVDEATFDSAELEDLPPDLSEQVNDLFQQLSFKVDTSGGIVDDKV